MAERSFKAVELREVCQRDCEHGALVLLLIDAKSCRAESARVQVCRMRQKALPR
jgi:hypothetical protein